MHAPNVIAHALLLIRQLSEKASEARNKHFPQHRENYSRKFSTKNYNEDIINGLLLNSDPDISSIRPRSKPNKQIMSKEALVFYKTSSEEVESSDEES